MAESKGEIASLHAMVSSLPREEKEAFERIFDVSVSEGSLRPPESMKPWLAERFGSVESAMQQQIVRVANLVTMEEALFNPLRASRPLGRGLGQASVHSGEDPLRDPLTTTPEDVFGRVEGKHCITAGNVAKYEAFHGVVVFNEPDPLQFTREQVIDYIDTGCRWAQEAHGVDPEASYFFFMWNCGERAGASLRHGHAQVMLGRRRHYSKIEHLRRAAWSYRDRYGRDYYEDLFHVHRSVGCGFERDGVRTMAYLSPVKEKETILMAPRLGLSLKERIYEVLACFRDRMGVTTFNLALYLPPIAEVAEDWEGFPAMARLVERGDSRSLASDIGTMELYASSVVSSDPFEVARVLKGCLSEPAD